MWDWAAQGANPRGKFEARRTDVEKGKQWKNGCLFTYQAWSPFAQEQELLISLATLNTSSRWFELVEGGSQFLAGLSQPLKAPAKPC